MDSFDAYYQQSDSKALLDEHGATLVADAREILGPHPEARVAGAIVLPDSREAPAFREALAKLTGQPVPEGLLVGVCPRQMIEAVLAAHVAPEHWREEPWQPQQTLPVVVATRDGSLARGDAQSVRGSQGAVGRQCDGLQEERDAHQERHL